MGFFANQKSTAGRVRLSNTCVCELESGEIGAFSGHALARGARIWSLLASRASAGQRGGVGSGQCLESNGHNSL
jgi:hypothetical protein